MSGKAHKKARFAVRAYSKRISTAADIIRNCEPPLIVRIVGFLWRPLLRKHAARLEIMAQSYEKHCLKVMEKESKAILRSGTKGA